jgi:hypothetical protein
MPNDRRREPVSSSRRPVTLPEPRCPFCSARMEQCQLMLYEHPHIPKAYIWHETWGCDSCHTEHTFPARREILELARNAKLLPRSGRTLYLPK